MPEGKIEDQITVVTQHEGEIATACPLSFLFVKPNNFRPSVLGNAGRIKDA
jgi:hypothetical protein